MAVKVTKSRLSKLRRNLKTDARIGRELGVSRQSVHQLRKKMGISTAASERRERDAEIAAAYIAGETGIAIAKKFGVSVSQTYRIINAANGKAKRKTAVKRAGAAGATAKKTAGRKPYAKKKTVAETRTGKKMSGKKTAPAKKKGAKKGRKK
jgi:hypothetical protein